MRSLVATFLFPAVALAVPPGLKKSEPLRCSGSENLVVSKRYIDVKKGDGIAAEGECKVTITDSQIVAKGYAVKVTGDAEVTIRNSVLEGGKSALYAVDRAKVKAQGNKLSGGILVMGQADYDDQGGNENERSKEEPASVVSAAPEEGGDEAGPEPEPEAAPDEEGAGEPEGEAKTVLPTDLRKSKPVVCRKSVKAITVKKRVIDANRDGIVIYGGCVVTVEQSLVKSKRGWAVAHKGNGKLIIKDSVLDGKKGALLVAYPTAEIEVGGSTLKGKLEKPAKLEIADQGGNTFEGAD